MSHEIYITGSTGLVGSRFTELSSYKEGFITPRAGELDITDKDALKRLFDEGRLDAVVNFAAFTDVGGAENQRRDENGACWKVNVDAVIDLAFLCKKKDIPLVHISTDMVFPGSLDYPGPYSEDAVLGVESELTWYGYTKAEAERRIRAILGDRAIILRLIYPVRANFSGKPDYCRKPLRFYDQGKLYPMFRDQQVSITLIDEACRAIETILDRRLTGIFHASSRDTTNPYDLISYLLEKARGVRGVVQPSSLEDFLERVACKARYPKYGGLRVEKTQELLDMQFSTWREIIDTLISQGLGG